MPLKKIKNVGIDTKKDLFDDFQIGLLIFFRFANTLV